MVRVANLLSVSWVKGVWDRLWMRERERVAYLVV